MKKNKQHNLFWLCILVILASYTQIKDFLVNGGNKGLIVVLYMSFFMMVFINNRFSNDIIKNIKDSYIIKKNKKQIKKILDSLNCNKIILKNVNLKVEECKNKIDNLVITEKGIFNIAIKNYSGVIIIDKNGNWFDKLKYCKKEIDDVYNEILSNKRVLEKILPEDYPIFNIIVTGENCKGVVGVQNSKIPAVSIKKLNNYILNYINTINTIKVNNDPKIRKHYLYEIETLIEYKSESKKVVKCREFTKVISNSKPLIALSTVVILGFITIGMYNPNKYLNSKNVSEEVTVSNNQVLIDEINCIVKFDNLVQGNYGMKVDFLIQNNSKSTINLKEFTIGLVDKNGNEKCFDNYSGLINGNEEKGYTLEKFGEDCTTEFDKIKIYYKNSSNNIIKEVYLLNS